jgi:hypothetical protein
VSPVLIGAQAQLQWPRLVHKNVLKFPITRVGNETVSLIIFVFLIGFWFSILNIIDLFVE